LVYPGVRIIVNDKGVPSKPSQKSGGFYMKRNIFANIFTVYKTNGDIYGKITPEKARDIPANRKNKEPEVNDGL